MNNNEEDLIRNKKQDKNGQVSTLVFHCHQVYSCLWYSVSFCLSVCRSREEQSEKQDQDKNGQVSTLVFHCHLSTVYFALHL